MLLFKLGFGKEWEWGYRLSLGVDLRYGAWYSFVIIRCLFLDGVARVT